MFRQTCAVVAFTAAIGVCPLGAFAQQMPDGTSANEPPAAGPQDAFDACGNSPQAAFGATTPRTTNDGEPKDVGTAQQRMDLSSVDGLVVHTAGDLVLLKTPMEPATGTDNPAPGSSMAVIRLPAGCSAAVPDGARLTVTGTPTRDGILDALRVQLED